MNKQKAIAAVIVTGIFAWSLAIITLIAGLLIPIPVEITNVCVIIALTGCAVYLTLFILAAISLRE